MQDVIEGRKRVLDRYRKILGDRVIPHIAPGILASLGYSDEFTAEVTAIIDGHDTRQEAHSIEDALMCDADRAWCESQGQDTIEVTDPATNTLWGSVPVGNEAASMPQPKPCTQPSPPGLGRRPPQPNAPR